MPTWRMCKTSSSERREKYPTDTSICGASILVVECYEYKLPTKKFVFHDFGRSLPLRNSEFSVSDSG